MSEHLISTSEYSSYNFNDETNETQKNLIIDAPSFQIKIVQSGKIFRVNEFKNTKIGSIDVFPLRARLCARL